MGGWCCGAPYSWCKWIASVLYSCRWCWDVRCVVFSRWREHNFWCGGKMGTKSQTSIIAQKKGGPRRRPTKLEAAAINWVTLLWSASRCVYFIRPNTLLLFYSVSFYFVYFSCTAQIHKLKFKSEYYLRINIGNCVKNVNASNHTLISWTILIGFLYFRETTC
jgi:hypothetical protein